MKRTAVIRTSDRVSYRKCRRRWNWQSHLRGNLTSKQKASPLWLGTGFHFALEMFHAPDPIYSSPKLALQAYAKATHRESPMTMPDDWREQLLLGISMVEYYEKWLETREKMQTFIYKGIPQLEVNFRIPIPLDENFVEDCGYDEVVYSGTIDRVAIDENGLLWLVEYKTAKQIQTGHFANDSQISSYCWAASNMYPEHLVAGVVYQQHRKDVPTAGRILQNGSVSSAANQKVTHRTYRDSLIEVYGDSGKFPAKCADLLNKLAVLETPDADAFIRRDKIFRNQHSWEAEGEKILMEASEMIDNRTLIYPNPTRDCDYMCPMKSACVSLDDGSDWEYELEAECTEREENYDRWRGYLPSLEELNKPKDELGITDLVDTPSDGWNAFVEQLKEKEMETA